MSSFSEREFASFSETSSEFTFEVEVERSPASFTYTVRSSDVAYVVQADTERGVTEFAGAGVRVWPKGVEARIPTARSLSEGSIDSMLALPLVRGLAEFPGQLKDGGIFIETDKRGADVQIEVAAACDYLCTTVTNWTLTGMWPPGRILPARFDVGSANGPVYKFVADMATSEGARRDLGAQAPVFPALPVPANECSPLPCSEGLPSHHDYERAFAWLERFPPWSDWQADGPYWLSSVAVAKSGLGVSGVTLSDQTTWVFTFRRAHDEATFVLRSIAGSDEPILLVSNSTRPRTDYEAGQAEKPEFVQTAVGYEAALGIAAFSPQSSLSLVRNARAVSPNIELQYRWVLNELDGPAVIWSARTGQLLVLYERGLPEI